LLQPAVFLSHIVESSFESLGKTSSVGL